jgi:hypothetical protein
VTRRQLTLTCPTDVYVAVLELQNKLAIYGPRPSMSAVIVEAIRRGLPQMAQTPPVEE